MESFCEAEVYLKKALLLSQSVLGKHAAATIHCVDQLVALFKAQNDTASALSYLQWSFDGKMAELGEDNLDTLTAAYGMFIFPFMPGRGKGCSVTDMLNAIS